MANEQQFLDKFHQALAERKLTGSNETEEQIDP